MPTKQNDKPRSVKPKQSLLPSSTPDPSKPYSATDLIPSKTWILGGNPRGGVVGEPQTITVTSRPQFSSNVIDVIHSTKDYRHETRIYGTDISKLDLATGVREYKSEASGKDLASGLRLRLITIPQSTNKSDANNALTETWTDFIPTVVPIKWKVTPNEDDSCDVNFEVPK